MISCDFRRFITISDKIDVGPSKTLKNGKVLGEHCIGINQLSLPSGLISASEFWQVKDRQNPTASIPFTTFSDFFRLIKLYIPVVTINCANSLLKYRNLDEVTKKLA